MYFCKLGKLTIRVFRINGKIIDKVLNITNKPASNEHNLILYHFSLNFIVTNSWWFVVLFLPSVNTTKSCKTECVQVPSLWKEECIRREWHSKIFEKSCFSIISILTYEDYRCFVSALEIIVSALGLINQVRRNYH